MNGENPFQTDPLKQKIDNPIDQFNSPGNPNEQPLDTGGPQFGFPAAEGVGKRRGWFNKYGSSVILPIIALLILAGGIYLYATQKTEQNPSLSESIPSSQEQSQPGLNEEQKAEGEVINPIAETEPIEQIVPAARKEGKTIVEKAIKGDSVTRLARRAISDYLKDHPQELTKEQKVYAEDFLKDQTGSRKLKVGEELSFSEDSIKTAIDGALKLTPGQLKNIEKYSALVVSW